jgi:Zn-dependent protease
MFSLLLQMRPELPITLALLALLGLRSRIHPKTSIFIKATPAKVWALIDVFHGKTDNWGRVKVLTELFDEATQTYLMTYTTSMANGSSRPFQAKFRIAERVAEEKLVLKRVGLEGKSENNELLEISHKIAVENDGSRLSTSYLWGSRPLTAQLLARADLWGGAYRLKGMAETGVPNNRPFFWISLGVAFITGLISLGAFGLSLGLPIALVLVFALFVHEFGHLLAFRLMGQPWGRMIFLPFIGAIAVPRLPYQSQGQSVFAALMGPGFSAILAVACLLPYYWGWQDARFYAAVGEITAGLNLANMIPAEPLDGGIALRSVLTRIVGKYASYALMAVGLVIAIFGFAFNQIILVLFGALAVLANLKIRKIDSGLVPLSTLQMCIAAFGYMAITAAHLTLLNFFLDYLTGVKI